MSKYAHTQGPWEVIQPNEHGIFEIINKSNRIARIYCQMPALTEKGEAIEKANARLIAGAPEMLSMLKTLKVSIYCAFEDGTTKEEREEAVKDISDLIIKVEGEEE